MARKKQQLINYHTSGATNMPQVEDVALGEIVVRHATDKPELLIKKDNNEFATFVDSSKVQSMISTSSANLQGQINAINNTLTTDYATSASTKAAIEAVDTKLTGKYATSAATVAAIEAVNTNLTTNYADSASTVAAIEAVNTNLTTNYADSASTVAAIEAVQGKVDAVDTKLDKAVSSLTDTINNKISSAYIYKGSCTYAELSAKEKVVGYVYNVTDAHDNVPAGTNYAWDGENWDALAGIVDLTIYATSANTEAAISAVQGNVNTLKNTLTKDYATSAATVAAIKVVDDKFAGYATSAATVAAIKVVDDKFANYADSASTKAAIEAVDVKFGSYATSADTKAAIEAVDVKFGSYATSADTKAAIEAVDDKFGGYATSADTESAIATAKSEAVSSGKGYTDGQISAVTSAYTKADADLDARIDKLEAISAHTQSAVQNVVVTNTDANKITATKTDEDNVVTLNFDNMVIDCGEF